MVVHRAERGNDLTKRTVDVYTLEELRSCRVDQIIAGIREFAQIVQAFRTDPAELEQEDSCAQLADDLLWKIDRLLEEVRNESVTPDLVAMIAIKVGQLDERLNWMWSHTEAARKGYLRKAHEVSAQRMGAKANKKRRRDNINKIVTLVKEFKPEERTLPDSVLERRLTNSGLGCDRTVRGYIAQACKEGLIPARQEK